MKKVITLTLALLVGGASLAAADGLNLFNGGCGVDVTGGLTGADVATWSCTSNTGNAFQAVASVILPVSVPGFIAAASEVLIDAGTGNPIPAYWTNTCRTGAFVQFFDPGTFPVTTSCLDIWSFDHVPTNAPLGVGNVYEPGSVTVSSGMTVGTGQMVLAGGGVLAGADAQNLVADGTTELVVFQIRITKVKSSGASLCAGCSAPVTAALTGLWLTGDSNFHILASPGNSTCILAQGATGGPLNCPGIVPTINRTWGAVKALYR